MSSYFTDYSGTTKTYSLTANPYANASISAGTLSVAGNYRNTTYTVTAQMTNGYSQTASTSTSVTESASPVNYTINPYSGNQLRGSSGLTLLYDSNTNDASVKITIPFTWTFLGTNYGNDANGGIYVGTNSYITFGAGSSVYSSLSATNPALKAIHIGSGDYSLQRLYGAYQSGNSWYLLRFEGTANISGTTGSPTIVWECIFLNQAVYGTSYNFWFCTGASGQLANSAGLAIVSNGTSQIASYTLNPSYYYEFHNFQ